MKTRIQAILNKEMSRRDFLKVFAGAMIATIGMNSFIARFMRPSQSDTTTRVPTTHGFGASKFGR
jgi:hypothetical protein